MNPELRRNLSLELSGHRLVAMPLVLVLVLAVLGAQAKEPWPLVARAATWLFVLMVHFWGTRQAAEAVTEEVRDRTWDWQRLSSLTPWQMTWGKLFGATAFAWYGGAWCLAALAVAQGVSGTDSDFAATAAALVASGIAIHGAALAGSLQAGRKDSRMGTRIGFLLVVPLLILFVGPGAAWGSFHGTIAWFGHSFESIRFVAASAVAFAAWGMLAVDREMSRELRVRKLPWASPAFAAFLGAYAAGFFPTDARGYAELFAWLSFFAALTLAYYGLFADLTTAMTLRRLALRLRARDYRRALDESPQWMVALAAAAVFAIAATCLPPMADLPAPMLRGLRRWIAVFPIVTLLAAVRDAGLLAFFALAPRPRRVEGTTMLYIVLLWWVVPALLGVMGFDTAARLVRPGGLSGAGGVVAMAAQVALVGAGVAWRWRRMGSALDRDPRKASARGV